jgi:hypothetical protein
VIPVSPNSFYAYLQTILLGLKGLRVEESAREIINHLARLNQEFDRFSESFRLVGDHLENALKKYEEAAEAPAQGGRQDGAARRHREGPGSRAVRPASGHAPGVSGEPEDRGQRTEDGSC